MVVLLLLLLAFVMVVVVVVVDDVFRDSRRLVKVTRLLSSVLLADRRSVLGACNVRGRFDLGH